MYVDTALHEIELFRLTLGQFECNLRLGPPDELTAERRLKGIKNLIEISSELGQLHQEIVALREVLAEVQGKLAEMPAQAPPKESLGVDLAVRRGPEVTAHQPKPMPQVKSTEELDNTLNHRSGCGLDVSVLRERFLNYMISRDGIDGWVRRTQMCHDTHAWRQFGKRVVDPLLNQMVAEGLIEVRSNGADGLIEGSSDSFTKFVRLTQDGLRVASETK